MKGYLNNLAQRLLNTGNRVEPRLPSLFEPNPEQIASYDEEVLTAPTRASLPQRRAEEKNTARQLPQYRRTTNNADPEIEHAATQASEHFRIDAEMPVESPAESPLKSSPLRSESLSREHTPEQQQLENPEIIEAPSSSLKPEPQITRMKADHVVDHSVDPPSSVSSVAQIDSPQIRRVIRPLEPAESHDDNVDVQSQITKEPEPQRQVETFNVARQLLTNPTSTPWRDTPQYQRRQRRQSVGPIDPETSINVTIGRVEVRAVPADRKTSVPRRSESPVMPLEEYLRKQRRGGER